MEQAFDFEGTSAAYTVTGEGPPLLLLHGSGPGASSLGNWRTVLPALAEQHTVYAMDLVGFGRSGRKPEPPYFDLDLWKRQATAMAGRIPGDTPIGVIGHSISATLAFHLAAREPRVAGVMTTGAMGAPFEPNETTRRAWRCPRDRAELRRAVEGLIHDASRIDDAYLAAREPVVFAPGYAEYFDAMFEGDPRRFVEAAVLPRSLLAQVRCPVLMVHGREDRGFPHGVTLELAAQLPQADVVLLARCSHSVAFEHPETFLFLARRFFAGAFASRPSA